MFQPISASSFVCLIVNFCEMRICQPIDIEVNSRFLYSNVYLV